MGKENTSYRVGRREWQSQIVAGMAGECSYRAETYARVYRKTCEESETLAMQSGSEIPSEQVLGTRAPCKEGQTVPPLPEGAAATFRCRAGKPSGARRRRHG